MAEKKAVARRKCGTGSKVSTEKVKKGTGYVCEVCGLAVVVDEVCGCVGTCDIVCCGEPMKEWKARTSKTAAAKTKKATVKAKK